MLTNFYSLSDEEKVFFGNTDKGSGLLGFLGIGDSGAVTVQDIDDGVGPVCVCVCVCVCLSVCVCVCVCVCLSCMSLSACAFVSLFVSVSGVCLSFFKSVCECG